MEKLKKNRKVVIISALIILALLAGGTYVATRHTDSPNKAKNAVQNEEKAKKVKQADKEQKEAEKALEEAKASGDEEAIKKAEAKVEKAQAKTKAASQSSTGGSSSPSSPATPKPSEKKKVWVVDKAAWTETVQEPIYATRTVFIASNWDNSQTKRFYSLTEAQAWLSTVDGGGYYEEDEQYISGYNTKTINHPEEGHWEYQ